MEICSYEKHPSETRTYKIYYTPVSIECSSQNRYSFKKSLAATTSILKQQLNIPTAVNSNYANIGTAPTASLETPKVPIAALSQKTLPSSHDGTLPIDMTTVPQYGVPKLQVRYH